MATSQSGAEEGINRRAGMGVDLRKTREGNRTEVNLKEESLKEAVRRGAAVQPGAEVGISRRVGKAVDLG